MRIARVRLQRFRGFQSADLILSGHTIIAGEPRSGRSDIVEALKRVLDPRSTRSRVNPLDIHRRTSSDDPDEASGETSDDTTTPTGTNIIPRTEVEVTLLDLGPELEDLLNEYLETFDSLTGDLADDSNAATSVLGMRLCYRAHYDFDSDTGDHWVDSPARSDVDAESFRKVPRADREVLPILFLNDGPPLQIRADGAFRALVSDSHADALDEALASLDEGVRTATETFSYSTALSVGVQQVLDAGAGDLLGIDSSDAVTFVSDDGTLATLLRVLQPAAILDDAGALPLRSHGTSAQSMLTVAECVAAATARAGDLVVIADDFGDQLDAAAAEHLAGLLHKASKQLILTTRRPEVVRAFNPESLIRLTRSTWSPHPAPASQSGQTWSRQSTTNSGPAFGCSHESDSGFS
jgi:putative ATP-dependent endonuclease of the OLD family